MKVRNITFSICNIKFNVTLWQSTILHCKLEIKKNSCEYTKTLTNNNLYTQQNWLICTFIRGISIWWCLVRLNETCMATSVSISMMKIKILNYIKFEENTSLNWMVFSMGTAWCKKRNMSITIILISGNIEHYHVQPILLHICWIIFICGFNAFDN